MKFCSLVAIACLAVATIGNAAVALGKGPGNSKLPVRKVKHVRTASSHQHGSDCGCGQTAIVEMPMASLGTCGGSCGAACTDTCGACEQCDPCLLSLMFDDMCNAVDSLFSCKGCRSSADTCCVEASACDDCGDWDPCAVCDDSKKRRSGRSPRRRPKCDSCGDCAGLWDGFCTSLAQAVVVLRVAVKAARRNDARSHAHARYGDAGRASDGVQGSSAAGCGRSKQSRFPH